MRSMGKKFDIPTPICDSLINIASSLLKRKFWKEGRTLKKNRHGKYDKTGNY